MNGSDVHTRPTHTPPITAAVNGIGIVGLSPGEVATAPSDAYAPPIIYLPTAMTLDGFPTGMVGFATGTGVVS